MIKSFFFTVTVCLVILSSALIPINAERYFAEIKNGTVVNVIVAEPSFISKLNGQWVETFRDHPTKTYAGIGYEFNAVSKTFAPEPLPQYVILQNQILKDQYEALKASRISSGNITGNVTLG